MEHAIRFVVKRSTQSAQVFVNGQPLGEMNTVRHMGHDLEYVNGYPFGWDGTSYRVEFLETHQFANGDDLGFGFTDKSKDESEPEGIGGRVVGVVGKEEHVVRMSDLWALERDGPNLRKSYSTRILVEDGEMRRDG